MHIQTVLVALILGGILTSPLGTVQAQSQSTQCVPDTVVASAVQDNLEMLIGCIQAGANVNASDPETGMTPLIAAAAVGQEQIVLWLLQQGADVTLRDQDQKTALMRAIEAEHREIAQMLFDVELAQGRLTPFAEPELAAALFAPRQNLLARLSHFGKFF